jgi:hypothetical protein
LSKMFYKHSKKVICIAESKQKLKKEHDSGPIPGAYCDCKQYLYIKSHKQQFCVNEKDSCIRLDDRIGKIVNILVREDEVYISYLKEAVSFLVLLLTPFGNTHSF